MSLFTDTRLRLGESSAGWWPDAQIYHALNSAQLNIFSQTKDFLLAATVYANPGDSLISIPSTIMIPQYIIGTSGVYWLTTQAKLEQYDKDWRAASLAYPKHWVLWDTTFLRPYPRPDAVYTFTVYGIPWPTEISGSVLDITGDASLKNAISNYAVALLFEHTRPDLAEAHMKESLEDLDRYKRVLRNYTGHNILRIRPGGTIASPLRGNISKGKSYI